MTKIPTLSKRDWLEWAINNVFALEDDDLLTAHYVKAILEAITQSILEADKMPRGESYFTAGTGGVGFNNPLRKIPKLDEEIDG